MTLMELPTELLLMIIDHLDVEDVVLGLLPIPNKRVRLLCEDANCWREMKLSYQIWKKIGGRDRLIRARNKVRSLTMLCWTEFYPPSQSQTDKARIVAQETMICLTALRDCPKLENLTLVSFAADPVSSTLLLMAIKERGTSLKKINVQLNPEILAANADCLRHVTSIRGLSRQDLKSLRAVLDHCQNLEEFQLMQVTEFFNEAAWNHFLEKVSGSLKHLEMWGSNGLTDKSYARLGQQCRRLEILHITHAMNLGVEGLAAIVDLPYLKKLLIRNRSLNGGHFARALKDKRMACLTDLRLSACSGFDDEAAEAVASSCRNLRKVLLLSCPLVTIQGIRSFMRSCPNLSVLRLALAPRQVQIERQDLQDLIRPGLHVDIY